MAERRLIDANARIEEIRKTYCPNCENYGGVKCRACWVDDAIGLIDEAPTVDAAPVVRCKDCTSYNGFNYCFYWEAPTRSMGYCHEGERRTDGSES